jgi:hypothetical protein
MQTQLLEFIQQAAKTNNIFMESAPCDQVEALLSAYRDSVASGKAKLSELDVNYNCCYNALLLLLCGV